MNINNLLTDIQTLWDSSKEDYHAQRFEPYEDYLTSYNALLKKANELGVDDLNPIAPVPDGEKAMYGVGTDAEKAKLREIVLSTERLFRRVSQINAPAVKAFDGLALLDNIFQKFHQVSRQLRDRHDNRPTLEIEDEYDVQDLLHALLRLFFDDIRTEEWTPSYAGGSSRMDFLLKAENLVIEVKKARKGLGAKEISNELLIDIGRYSSHPECKTLICFIYDPEGKIGNPIGVERDLNNKSTDNMQVVVFIRPR